MRMDEDGRKAPGAFRIARIWYAEVGGRARVACDLAISSNGGSGHSEETKTLFFEVPGEYGKYLVWERCDAFVVLLLHTALAAGYDIRSDVPMSSDLYHNIAEYVLPSLTKNGPFDIRVEAETAPPLERGNGIGTGLSCGVDSLHAVHKYSAYPIEEFRLTHLCINDVGAFNDSLYWKAGGANVRDNTYRRARAAAEDIGLPLIETSSNVAKALRLNHFLTNSFSSAFAALCMKKLWRRYYYASDGRDSLSEFSLKGWCGSKPSTYEPFLLRALSTPSFELMPVGETESETEKIAEIADYDIARRHLYSCTWDLDNCCVCKKCIRNLTALDALGKLDGFSEPYDLGYYRKHRWYYMWKVYEGRDDGSSAEVYDMLMEKGDPQMQEVSDIAEAVEEFDRLWEEDTAEADKKAVARIRPYLNRAKKPNFRMARAYEAGRGVKKSHAKATECLEYCLSEYKAETEAGFQSVYQLFDLQWRLRRDDELLATIEPMLEYNRPEAKARLARMYAKGRGVERDPSKARELMCEAAKRKPLYRSEYEKMLKESEEGSRDRPFISSGTHFSLGYSPILSTMTSRSSP